MLDPKIPLVSILLCAAAAATQVLAEGHAATTAPLPNGTQTAVRLADGAVAYFADGRLTVVDGGATRDLLVLPATVFASFLIEARRGELLLGESTTGGIWSVAANGSGARLLTTLPFNYAATTWRRNLAIVSARTGGGGAAANDIIAVDLDTGAVDAIARVPGASGPVAADHRGDLYYATAATTFPPPPGSVDILRFPATAVQRAIGPRVLDVGAAAVVLGGQLRAASALALDDDDDLFLTDWFANRVVEISELHGSRPRLGPLLDYQGLTLAPVGLQVLDRAAAGPQLEPFQPPGGPRLLVFESTFGGPAGWREVAARRPTLTVDVSGPIPPGPFHLEGRAGPGRGIGLLVVGRGREGRERRLRLDPFEQPLFWRGPAAPMVVLAVGLDAAGGFRLAAQNPGGVSLQVLAQVAVVDATATTLGSTPALALSLAAR